jgi:titin
LPAGTVIQSVSGTFDAANPTALRTITLSNPVSGTGSSVGVNFKITKNSLTPRQKIIGLFFAGDHKAETGIACRIDHVAEALNIRAWDEWYVFSSYSVSKSNPIVLRASDFSSSDPNVPLPENINSDLYKYKDVGGNLVKYWHSGCTLQNYFSAEAPTDIILDNTDIPLNAPIGGIVGQFSVVDPDITKGVLDVYQYSLISGSGGESEHNSLFRITSNLLRVNGALTTGDKRIRVRVTDTRGRSFPKAFTLNVSASITRPTPANVAGVAGNGQVSLTWSPPILSGGQSVMHYLIEYGTSDSFASFAKKTIYGAPPVPTATSAIVGGLTNGVDYYFRVRASLSDGTLTDASTASAAIKPKTIPNAPTGVIAQPSSAGVISLTWTPPVNDGGSALTDYSVEYSDDARFSWNLIAESQSTLAYYDATGLNPAKSYLFRVRAKNAVGFSATWAETSVAVSPPITPNPPTAVTIQTIGNGQVTISWTAPTNIAAGAITDYLIQYKTVAAADWSNFTDSISSGLNTTVTGLTNDTAYVFRVKTRTGFGDSDYSTASASATPQAVPPNAPTITSLVPGDQQVTVNWSSPTNNGGASIVDYIVEYKATTSTTWATFDDGMSATTSAVVEQLTNGVAYQFRVSAVNSAGTGTVSAASSASTPFGQPSAPLNLALASPVAYANKTVNLSWSGPASNGGSAITNYVVAYRVSGAVSWIVFNNAVGATTISVTGLINGTEYEFSVQAKNSGVNLSPRATITATPPIRAPQTAPRTLSATPTNQTITLSWLAPLDNGGEPITSYLVSHRLNQNPPSWTVVETSDASTTYAISGLTNDVEYKFKVAAKNTIGTGPTTSELLAIPSGVVTAPSAPTITSATPGAAQVSLAWDAPTNNGGEAVSSYMIEYNESGQTTWTEFTVSGVTFTTSPRTITGLTNGTEYYFRVSAANSAGFGDASAAFGPVKPVTVPGTPTITAVTAGDEQVSVEWNAPSDNGGATISNYIIEYSEDAFIWDEFTVSGTTFTTSPQTVTGLTNDTAYYFRVAAVNSAGTGDWTTWPTPVTPVEYTGPTPPREFTAALNGDYSAITFNWKAPLITEDTTPDTSTDQYRFGYYTASTAGTITGTITGGSAVITNVVTSSIDLSAIQSILSSNAIPVVRTITGASNATVPDNLRITAVDVLTNEITLSGNFGGSGSDTSVTITIAQIGPTANFARTVTLDDYDLSFNSSTQFYSYTHTNTGSDWYAGDDIWIKMAYYDYAAAALGPFTDYQVIKVPSAPE